MVDIVVPERQYAAPRQLRAGKQAGVREFVGQHEIFRSGEHRNDAGVRQIARAEHAGRFRLLHRRQPGFEFGVKRMIAGHQSRGAGARAVFLNRRDGGLLDRRMLGEVEIVVA